MSGASSLQAGAAKVVITPAVGTDLAGFAGRDRGAVGILDDLAVRVLVLARGQRRVVLVALDLIGLPSQLAQGIREGVAAAVGTAADQVLLACSHTHSGPTIYPFVGMGTRDPGYLRLLPKLIRGAALAAAARLAPAVVGATTAESFVGINRRQRRPDGRTVLGQHPEGPVDRRLRVLRVDRTDGRPVAVVYSTACHPVCLGSANLHLSADFVAWSSGLLEREHGGAALFVNGCCGNINPAVMRSRAAAERTGRMLGGATLAALQRIWPETDGPVAAGSRPVEVPLQPLPDEAAAAAIVESCVAQVQRLEQDGEQPGRLRSARAVLDWAKRLQARVQLGQPLAPLREQVSAAVIGDFAIAGLPCEPFVEIGQAIAAASPVLHTASAGYVNGCFGYAPVPSAYPEGGYEVETAHRYYDQPVAVAPEAAGILERTAVDLLCQLHHEDAASCESSMKL